MKKSLFFLCVLVSSVSVYGQEWTTGSGLIYSNNNKVSIGATSVQGGFGTSESVLQLVAPSTNSAFLTLKSGTKGLTFGTGPYGNALYINENDPFNFSYGANTVLNINPSGNIGIGTISPTAKLHLSGGTGDSELFIEADTDNANEMDNPFITLSQDNNQVQGFIGLVGNNNTAPHVNKYPRWTNETGTWEQKTDYPGTLANYLFIGMNNSEGVQLGSSGNARLTVHHNGNTGIGTTSPQSKLQVSNGSSGGSVHGYSELTLEDDDHVMMNLLSPNNKIGYYGFSDTDDNFVGGMQYEHASNLLRFRVNNHDHDMVIRSNGYVGIGTTAPEGALHIVNNTGLLVDDASIGFPGRINMTDGFTNTTTKDDMLFESDGAFLFKLDRNGNGISNLPGFGIYDKNNEAIFFAKDDGNVGIGTMDTKGYKLGVQGKIAAEEVKVALYNNWPDYVFEDAYSLPTLQQVEDHIITNGHLINIPSAAEVEENGIQLGEMNAKLLEKIEELTLYTIAQEKKLKEQEKSIKAQKTISDQLITNNQNLEARLAKIEALLKK
ncbi:hypothetical protein [uncultured Aquimarina sp.]|uniref:hypothetical protein n=1 Tax=uncultured Aquimarina sp. TaxID=575652 RepID=UPI002635AF8A|nr:hypothetical protein [uncultured Aquimarina sp.]